eukprot:2186422-Rhodomonas_salina.1
MRSDVCGCVWCCALHRQRGSHAPSRASHSRPRSPSLQTLSSLPGIAPSSTVRYVSTGQSVSGP